MFEWNHAGRRGTRYDRSGARRCARGERTEPPRRTASSSCRSKTCSAKGAFSGSAKRPPCCSPTNSGRSARTRLPGRSGGRRSSVCRCPRPPTLTDATIIRIGQLVGAARVDSRHARTGPRHARRPRAQRCPRLGPRRDQHHRSRFARGTVSDVRTDCASDFAVFEICRRDQAAAPAPCGLREFHQGAARRNAGDGDQLPERGTEAAADVRPRANRVVGRVLPSRAITRKRLLP